MTPREGKGGKREEGKEEGRGRGAEGWVRRRVGRGKMKKVRGGEGEGWGIRR